MSEYEARCASVHIDSWAGRRVKHVRVLRETPKRFECVFDDGRTRLVPKRSVVLLLPGECLIHDVKKSPPEGA